MSIAFPVSCVSDTFSSYHVSFCLVYWNYYHLTNYICTMMILMMMGLDPVTLVRALSLFALMNPLTVLENPLVVSVAWGLEFFFLRGIESIDDVVTLVVFVPK